MEINWNHVRNDEVLQSVKEERNILQTIKLERPSKTCYGRKDIGKDRSDGRRARRRRQLLDDPKEVRGSWKLKEEALDRTL